MSDGRAPLKHWAPRTNRRIGLRDGRWLGFAEYGDARGMPLFVFHGTPGSRLMVRAAHEAGKAHGVRLIAPDRPGFGLSSRQAGRRIGDWPQDVAELADALEIPRFGVVGVSGGGPYALACAWRIPERLRVVGSVSGLAPMAGAGPQPDRQDHALLTVARRAPWLGRPLAAFGAFAWRCSPGPVFRQLQRFGPPADRVVLARPDVARALITGVREAFRDGSQGTADELRLFSRPWDFPLEEVAIPVHVWHGARDTLVPCAAAHRLARLLPDCRLEIVPDGGHYLAFDMIDSLLAALRRETLAGQPRASSKKSGTELAPPTVSSAGD
jgi:pimeloyl-ACP methyl ester carboxylesterase